MPVRATCITLLLVCAGLYAQHKNPKVSRDAEDSTTRTVQGVVTNAANQTVERAVVQLENTKTLQIRSFITQKDGMYHFAGLSTDVEYRLKADYNGASTSWKTLSVFNTKKTAVINLRLKK